MKILTWIASIIIGLAVLLLTLANFLPGYHMYVARSDSMKPVFSAGDLLIMVPLASPLSSPIRPGMIVTYDLGDERVTHRVISINQGIFITKGDANEEPDQRPVQLSQIEGVYLLRIPDVGRLIIFMRTRTGWFLLVVLPAMLLVGLIVKDIVKEALGVGKTAQQQSQRTATLNVTGKKSARQL